LIAVEVDPADIQASVIPSQKGSFEVPFFSFNHRRRCVLDDIRTHFSIDQSLCGKPLLLENGESRVVFTATPEMAADKSGLVHGGFVFGLADYAAMLAVNHPNVVLGLADVKFLKPVRVGNHLEARALVQKVDGKKQVVDVVVKKGQKKVFTGRFTCFVLETHILD